MDLNRNQFFMGGLVLLFLGIQFRMVDTFTFNEKVTRFLATQMKIIDDPGAPATAAVIARGRVVEKGNPSAAMDRLRHDLSRRSARAPRHGHAQTRGRERELIR